MSDVHRAAVRNGTILTGGVAGLAVFLLAAGTLAAQTATPVAIAVLSAGAVEPGLRSAATAFEKHTGHAVTIVFAPAPQIRTRVLGGEVRDVVIATPAVLEELAKVGKVEAGHVALGRVGMGVAVRAGAPVPDISTVEAFRRSLLDAESLVFTRGSSGVYFESLLKKMGVYDRVERRISRHDDGESAFAYVLKSRGRDVGVGQLTEIQAHLDEGLRLVGPLPADVQNYTPYSGASMTGRPNAQAARAFVQYLGGPDGRAAFAAAGIEP